VSGETLERMLLLDLPNRPDGLGQHGFGNPSKYLFYQDPIGGVFDRHTNPLYDEHYAQDERLLRAAAKESPHYAYVYTTLAELSGCLVLKANVGIRLREAYQKGDKATLKAIAETELPAIRKRLARFMRAMEKQWEEECKPQGYDVLDGRFGWLLERLLSAERRLKAYLKDPKKSIPELAETPLYIDGRQEKGDSEIMSWNWWGRNASVNPIG
jgi:hexosaminidase